MPISPTTVEQPTKGVGSVEETNRLLGGDYFDPSGAPVKAFNPTVVTDANVREKVIPETLAKFNDLVKTGTPAPSLNPPENGNQPPGETGDYSDLYKSLAESLGLGRDGQDTETHDTLEKLRASLDATTASTIGSIKGQYGELETKLGERQDAENGKLETALLNAGASGTQGGLSRYSPGSAAGLVKMKAKADIQALGDLHTKEQHAIASANTAKANKDFQLLQVETKNIENLRKQKVDLAKKVSDSLIKENTKARAAKVKASRDASIIGLVGQGVTDPKDLLGYLNYDEQGNQTGDFTVDEITKTLKGIAPADDLKGLSGNVKNFMVLKSHGELPGNIATLPEEQQLYGYLRGLKEASRISSGDPHAPSTHKLTLSDIQSLSLPMAVLGESEKSIVESFKQTHPPQWFMDRLTAEQGNDNYADTKWQEFQKTHINPPAKKTTAPSGGSSGTSLY